MSDHSTTTVEQALPDARRYCLRDGVSWIMRDPAGRYHILNPYSEAVKKHYLEKAKYVLCVELVRGCEVHYVEAEGASQPKGKQIAEHLATLFHDTYERLAPNFGYAARQDTKQFDPKTPNGRLMIAVCGAMVEHLPAFNALREIKLHLHFTDTPGESMWNVGTDKRPRWVPDWRYPICLLEHALHGSPIDVPERPKDTKRRIEVCPSPREMESALRAILAVAEKHDTPSMNVIRDAAKQALKTGQS